jgi:hypothetical protein
MQVFCAPCRDLAHAAAQFGGMGGVEPGSFEAGLRGR